MKKTVSNHVRITRGDRVFYAIIYSALGLLTLIVLYPLIYVVSSSFSAPASVLAGKVVLWPVDFSLEGYTSVFKNQYIGIGFRNSVLYTVCGTFLNVLLTMMCAYPLASKDLPHRGKIMFIFTFTMFFSGGMIPNYREMLKYVNMLVKEDLLDEAAFTQTRSEMRAQLQADTQTIGMMFGSANGFGQNIASWQPLEMPVGYYGDRIVSVENPVPGVSSAISADCEHPEVAFALLNLGYTSDLGNFFWVYSARYGEKDVDWVYADPNADSIFKELGIKPSLKQLQMTWGVETKSHWQVSFFPSIYAGDFAIEEFDGNEAHGERLHGRSVAMNMPYAPAVSDVVPASLLYTDEERDEWDSVRSALQSYIIESSALFSVGQWDPNDDNAWQSYLDELNVLRYKDLIAMDQAVYNRTMGIE